MPTIYALQSTFTSDPYEPSETLVWGLFTSDQHTKDAFREIMTAAVHRIRLKWAAAAKARLGIVEVGRIQDSIDTICDFIITKRNGPIVSITETHKSIKEFIAEEWDVALRNSFLHHQGPVWETFCRIHSCVDGVMIVPGLNVDSFEVVTYELDRLDRDLLKATQ